MKNSEIVEMTDQEILDLIVEEKANLVRMRMGHSITPLENPHVIRESKRLIARLKTELRKRELKQENK